MQNLEQIIDNCYAGYCAVEDNPMPKEDWVKLPQAKQFINKMKRIQKIRNSR
jgi:hypothetical protein